MKQIKKTIGIYLLPLTTVLLIVACDETFEPDLRKEKIVLFSPIDSVASSDTLQKFYWEDTQNNANYQLQIVSPRFDSMVKLIADTITTKNQIDLKLQRGLQYQWHVRAVNSSYVGVYSSARTIWIQ